MGISDKVEKRMGNGEPLVEAFLAVKIYETFPIPQCDCAEDRVGTFQEIVCSAEMKNIADPEMTAEEQQEEVTTLCSSKHLLALMTVPDVPPTPRGPTCPVTGFSGTFN